MPYGFEKVQSRIERVGTKAAKRKWGLPCCSAVQEHHLKLCMSSGV